MKYTRAQKTASNLSSQSTFSTTPLPPGTSTIYFHKEYLPPCGFLSQWFLSPFTDPTTSTVYNSAEQYMMHHKALHFSDSTTAATIMKTTSPSDQKSLGKRVKGFKDKEWDKVKFEVVCEGCWRKYMCGEEWLRERLLETGERELVEASPGDRVWGVGFREEEAEVRRAECGMNLLGRALMTTRERIRGEVEGRGG